jgi:Zn-dependent peptidase ImmA (M78 family)
MSLRIVREAAESLAHQHSHDSYPIDVKSIATALGLKILYEELPEEVSGLLVTGPSGNFIIVQKSDSEHRKRFTIAHEIAHFSLGHRFVKGEHVHVDRGHYVSQRSPRSSTGLDPKEVEANQFAASLLMPSQLIEKAIARLRAQPLLDHHISSLATSFNVSEQAMTIRLNSLGVL